jgi:hypothetical protein
MDAWVDELRAILRAPDAEWKGRLLALLQRTPDIRQQTARCGDS